MNYSKHGICLVVLAVAGLVCGISIAASTNVPTLPSPGQTHNKMFINSMRK